MSKYFQDFKGKQWEVTITIGSIMRVKSKLDIDLINLEAGEPPLIQRIGTDDLLIAQILEALLEKQLSETSENLYDLFDGETLIKAQTAFYEELSDFFLKSGKTHKAGMIRKMNEVMQKAIIEATSKVNEVGFGEKYGDLPDKSE